MHTCYFNIFEKNVTFKHNVIFKSLRVFLFDVHVTVLHDKFLIIKSPRFTDFSNFFLE